MNNQTLPQDLLDILKEAIVSRIACCNERIITMDNNDFKTLVARDHFAKFC